MKKKPLKLFCESLGGNLFTCRDIINKHCPEIIPGIVHMEFTGSASIIVYRAEQEHPFFKREI